LQSERAAQASRTDDRDFGLGGHRGSIAGRVRGTKGQIARLETALVVRPSLRDLIVFSRFSQRWKRWANVAMPLRG
jgi:hypothetical protein